MGGGDKPLRLLAGQTMLARIIVALAPAPIAISANGDPSRFAMAVPVLPDEFPGQGPLAGVLAGLADRARRHAADPAGFGGAARACPIRRRKQRAGASFGRTLAGQRGWRVAGLAGPARQPQCARFCRNPGNAASRLCRRSFCQRKYAGRSRPAGSPRARWHVTCFPCAHDLRNSHEAVVDYARGAGSLGAGG
jgi:hypothetical protein